MPVPGWELTVCGLAELGEHGTRDVTHVLSIIDPDEPDPADFARYGREHHRLTLRYHDIIADLAGWVPPTPAHVEQILSFGADLDAHHPGDGLGHLLIHCHAGVSRSTAAMAILMARLTPLGQEAGVFERLVRVRRQAWPNSRMVAFGDGLLGRGGRLVEALRDHYRRQAAALPDMAEAMRHAGREAEVPELSR